MPSGVGKGFGVSVGVRDGDGVSEADGVGDAVAVADGSAVGVGVEADRVAVPAGGTVGVAVGGGVIVAGDRMVGEGVNVSLGRGVAVAVHERVAVACKAGVNKAWRWQPTANAKPTTARTAAMGLPFAHARFMVPGDDRRKIRQAAWARQGRTG